MLTIGRKVLEYMDRLNMEGLPLGMNMAVPIILVLLAKYEGRKLTLKLVQEMIDQSVVEEKRKNGEHKKT